MKIDPRNFDAHRFSPANSDYLLHFCDDDNDGDNEVNDDRLDSRGASISPVFSQGPRSGYSSLYSCCVSAPRREGNICIMHWPLDVPALRTS
jgi:hypothetical protein